jgi:polyisoprenoid-binding protein YceI
VTEARLSVLSPGNIMGNWVFEPGHTSAEFCARHMMVTYVRGHFKDIHGTLSFNEKDPASATVEVTIDARGLWTGEAARDAHLRSADFLDVERYFDVHHLDRWSTPWWEGGVDKGPRIRAGFVAETTINRHDFDVSWNSPLELGGVVVGDEVHITIDAEAILEEELPRSAS